MRIKGLGLFGKTRLRLSHGPRSSLSLATTVTESGCAESEADPLLFRFWKYLIERGSFRL